MQNCFQFFSFFSNFDGATVYTYRICLYFSCFFFEFRILFFYRLCLIVAPNEVVYKIGN